MGATRRFNVEPSSLSPLPAYGERVGGVLPGDEVPTSPADEGAREESSSQPENGINQVMKAVDGPDPTIWMCWRSPTWQGCVRFIASQVDERRNDRRDA